VSDIAGALGFAHRNGVVHRDVKPGNVLITPDGAVKVADFGIARALSDTSDQNLTKTGSVMGTATYFSPEQARGAQVDPRSDLYSLGCVLYELITGRPPFAGDSAMAIAYKHVQENPVTPRQIDPALPETLEAITLKCLAKNPDNRYPSAQDLRADLRRYLDGNRILAEPVLAPPVDPAATGLMAPTAYDAAAAGSGQAYDDGYYDEEPYEDYYAEEPEKKRSKGFLVVLVALLLILAGLLFFLATSSGDGDETPQVAVPGVVGQPEAQARATLEAEGFEVTTVSEASEEPEGNVISQDPEGGSQADEGSQVQITVSGGPDAVAVPDVTNQTQDEATSALEAAGFIVVAEEVASNDVEEGRVVSQNPAGGSEAAPQSQVTIQVAAGPETVAVPDVTGQDEASATNALVGAGFRPQRSSEASNDVEAGRVIRTEPAAGTQVAPESNVTIVVSSGPDNVGVPNVEGLSEDAARTQLSQFNVQVTPQRTDDPGLDGTVASQTPTAGSEAAPGSTVSLVVWQFVESEDPGPTLTVPTTPDGGNGGGGDD
jgi:serine/threonine-protein kinase